MNQRCLHTLAVALWIAAAAAAHAAKPNVIFILADDLGWADTTLYGHTQFHRTPNLDRLAKRGMLFTRAHSASPLCSPTRSAIMTGLSPARTGITVAGFHEAKVILEAALAKGLAFGTRQPEHLLNVRAANMSALQAIRPIFAGRGPRYDSIPAKWAKRG